MIYHYLLEYLPPLDTFHSFILIFQDINELELPKTCKTEFPDPDDLLSFKLVIYPDEVKIIIISLAIIHN